jgi:hypothetical protein
VTQSDFATVKNLAALIFGDGEDVNRVVADFARDLAGKGHRLGGVIQVSADSAPCECKEVHVVDIETGARLPLLQDLGKYSQSCRIDQAALAQIGLLLSDTIKKGPELLFIRFGKLEAEGKGVIAEIGAAATSGIPTLVSVPARYLAPWRQFTMGLDEELSCSSANLHRWWTGVIAVRDGVT